MGMRENFIDDVGDVGAYGTIGVIWLKKHFCALISQFGLCQPSLILLFTFVHSFLLEYSLVINLMRDIV